MPQIFTVVLTLSIIYSSFLLLCALQEAISANVSHISLSEMSWISQHPLLDQLLPQPQVCLANLLEIH